MIIFLAMALPGRLLAISAHEFGHAWVAYRCGDPTAKSLGRMTLNPFKHLDLIGTIMMVVFGFGYAKPVPVNPLHFRHYRRDDLLVSLAGVTMNLLMFIAGCLCMYAWLGSALSRLPQVAASQLEDGVRAITTYQGSKWIYDGQYPYGLDILLKNAPYLSRTILTGLMGGVGATLFQMLGYFVQGNLALYLFNLIPLPPLDGYHVLNDLVLKRDVFATRKMSQYGTMALLLLMVSGVLSKGLGAAMEWVLGGVGDLARAAFSAIGAL